MYETIYFKDEENERKLDHLKMTIDWRYRGELRE